MLRTIQGGASARPFVTHHNALDIDMYLRIALELHLKRLIVGGMERVFEIGRVFRNEGIDTRHNPEFTMLEAYQAFADYHDMMDLVEGMVTDAARAALGDELVVHYGGHAIDLAATPWPRARFADMIAEKTGAVMHPGMPIEEARAVLDRLGIAYERSWGAGRLMKEVYDEKVQHDVVGPVFCIDYPREVSPLARVHRDDPDYVERFELIVAGFELCNAYSEQNDPVEQLAAFEAEARAKAGGDPEAGDIDLDYVRALEQGMPCTGGLGIGIDRLVMLLASVDSIREVILFPTLRPEFAPEPGTGPRDAPRPLLPPTPVPAAGVGADGDGHRAGPGRLGRRPARTWRPPPTRSPRRRARGATRAASRCPPSRCSPRSAGCCSCSPRCRSCTPGSTGARSHFGPLWFPVAGHIVSVIVGFVLLLLADQLAKRKRLAWRVATALFAIAGVAARAQGPAPGRHRLLRGDARGPGLVPARLPRPRRSPVVAAAVAVHPAVPDRGPGLRAGRAVDAARPDHPGAHPRRGAGDDLRGAGRARRAVHLRLAVLRRVLPGGAGRARDRRAGRVRRAAVPPARRRRHPHTSDDWAHASRLVHTYGWDTLAYFALRDDKSFFFSRDGEAFIAYTYIRGYALVSGDPIGARESVVRVLDEFLEMCAERAWNPALLAVREASMPLYASRGFTSFYLGDEAIIDSPRFSLDGPRAQEPARGGAAGRPQLPLPPGHRVERLAAAGGAAQRDQRQVAGQGARARLHDVAIAGHRGAGANPEFLLCVALDSDGVPGGFLRVVPAYGPSFGYTLDLMRHDPGAPNGMTEFLIASTAAALQERGVARLSMNFAMWGRLFAEDVPFSPDAARRAVGRRRAEPVLPDQVAARLQREVRPGVASAGAGRPQPGRPAAGRPAVRRRGGLPRDPGYRRAAGAQGGRRASRAPSAPGAAA